MNFDLSSLSPEEFGTSLDDDTYPDLVIKTLTSGFYLNGDNLQRVTESYSGAVYRKLEYVTRPGWWRGKFIFPGILPMFLPHNHLLVYGHSSASLPTPIVKYLQRACRGSVAGTNRSEGWRSHPIPLGLPNTFLDSPDHAVFGDVRPIESALRIPKSTEFARSLYANFDPTTHSSRRGLALVIEQMGLPLSFPDRTKLGRHRYLEECRRADFVLCPRGVGDDTHRMWESLFVGTIPVVERSPLMEFFAARFPILLVDDWMSLAKTDLAVAHERLMSKKWDVRLLDVRAWIHPLADGSVRRSH